MRYERKFIVDNSEVSLIKDSLFSQHALFTEIYPTRTVNNLYFDTPHFQMFQSNILGEQKRIKCRLRWYGEGKLKYQQPKLELKIKNGHQGKKIRYEMLDFENEPEMKVETLTKKTLETLSRNNLDFLQLEPTLLNSYRRSYFSAVSEEITLTIDDKLKFCPIHSSRQKKIFQRIFDKIIIEIKYGIHTSPELVSQLTQNFKTRYSRCSKYVLGLQH